MNMRKSKKRNKTASTLRPMGYYVEQIEKGMILPCTKKDRVSNTRKIKIVANT